jgi:hypothetical protein
MSYNLAGKISTFLALHQTADIQPNLPIKVFPGLKFVWALQKGVEILGPFKMSLFRLAGCPKQVLDS